MALVDRQVDRLAQRAPTVVERRAQVGELGEVAEVLDRGVSTPALEVAHEGRPIGRGKDQVGVADGDGPLRVACVLNKTLWRRRLDKGASEAVGKANPAVDNGRSGALEDLQSLGKAVDLHANFGEQPVGVVLDEAQSFFFEDFNRLERSGEEGNRIERPGGSCRLPGRSATAPSSLFHDVERDYIMEFLPRRGST